MHPLKKGTRLAELSYSYSDSLCTVIMFAYVFWGKFKLTKDGNKELSKD